MAKEKTTSGSYRSTISGSSRSLPASNSVSLGERVNAADVESVMGKGWKNKISGMSGLKGAKIHVGFATNRVLYVSISHKDVLEVEGMVEGTRESKYNLVIRGSPGMLNVGIDELYKSTSSSPDLAFRVIGNLVENKSSFGVSSLSLTASGVADKYKNRVEKIKKETGFYVWAKMGFDGSLSDTKLPAGFKKDLASSPYKGAKRVQDIVSKPGGLAWWRGNGVPFVSTGNSLSAGSPFMDGYNRYKRSRARASS